MPQDPPFVFQTRLPKIFELYERATGIPVEMIQSKSSRKTHETLLRTIAEVAGWQAISHVVVETAADMDNPEYQRHAAMTERGLADRAYLEELQHQPREESEKELLSYLGTLIVNVQVFRQEGRNIREFGQQLAALRSALDDPATFTT